MSFSVDFLDFKFSICVATQILKASLPGFSTNSKKAVDLARRGSARRGAARRSCTKPSGKRPN